MSIMTCEICNNNIDTDFKEIYECEHCDKIICKNCIDKDSDDAIMCNDCFVEE
jgi:hypothetical protein